MEDSDTNQTTFQVRNGVLSYTGRNITRIPDVFWKVHGSKIQQLDLSFNCINNVYGLDQFKVLNELILDNNDIGDTVKFPHMPMLRTLSLNKNKINDLPLFMSKLKSSFPNLTFLSMLGNKACPNELSDPTKDESDYKRYRFFVLHHLQTLRFLDSASVTANERKEAAIKGQFMQIRKPKELNRRRERYIEENLSYTPLPTATRPLSDHRGACASFQLRFNNKDSEGNRFIVNSDL